MSNKKRPLSYYGLGSFCLCLFLFDRDLFQQLDLDLPTVSQYVTSLAQGYQIGVDQSQTNVLFQLDDVMHLNVEGILAHRFAVLAQSLVPCTDLDGLPLPLATSPKTSSFSQLLCPRRLGWTRE